VLCGLLYVKLSFFFVEHEPAFSRTSLVHSEDPAAEQYAYELTPAASLSTGLEGSSESSPEEPAHTLAHTRQQRLSGSVTTKVLLLALANLSFGVLVVSYVCSRQKVFLSRRACGLHPSGSPSRVRAVCVNSERPSATPSSIRAV
jgi:hypothetical protein